MKLLCIDIVKELHNEIHALKDNYIYVFERI